MKKYLIYLSLLISFFIFSNNVKAEATPEYEFSYLENEIQTYKYYEANSERYKRLNPKYQYVSSNGYTYFDEEDRSLIIADSKHSYIIPLQGDYNYTYNNFMIYQSGSTGLFIALSTGDGPTAYKGTLNGNYWWKANSDTYMIRYSHGSDGVDFSNKSDFSCEFFNSSSESGFWASPAYGLQIWNYSYGYASTFDLYLQGSFSSTTKTKKADKTMTLKEYKPDPYLRYEILDGTERGKMLKIYFYNFYDGDNGILTNFQTGKKYIFPSMPLSPTFTLDNINQDNSFTFNAYDKDNNLILTETIDIQNEIAELNNERYIEIFNLNTTRLNDYFVKFHNTKSSDKCYVKINNSSNTGETELDCDSEFADIYSPRNTFVENYIKNSKGEIVVKKTVNLNYIKDLPQIEFESTFNENETRQDLKITITNFKNSDKFYYSYDNQNWELLETKRVNYLYFYTDSDVYVKVVRDDEIVSEAYFDVVYNSFENSSNNNNLEDKKSLKGLLKYFKTLTKEISFEPFLKGVNAYELIKNSKLGLFILLVVIGSIIILVMKSLKR